MKCRVPTLEGHAAVAAYAMPNHVGATVVPTVIRGQVIGHCVTGLRGSKSAIEGCPASPKYANIESTCSRKDESHDKKT